MELLYLRTFCELVKWGTYTRTALELDYAQSSITNHIQRLEQLYGGQRLLIRSGNKVLPTAAGERLLPYARQMLELQQAAHEALQQTQPQAAVLTIGTIESLSVHVLPELLELFRDEHPNCKVRIVLASESELLTELRQGKIDIALVLDTPMAAEGMITAILFAVQMAVLLPHHHPLHQQTGVKAADLHEYPLILTEEGCTYRAYLLRTLQVAGVTANIRWEMVGMEAIRQAVGKSWGLGFLPLYAVQGMDMPRVNPGGMHVLPWTEQDVNLYVQLLYPVQVDVSTEAFVRLSRLKFASRSLMP
ncbi:LysR family transcriptional regulator [Paenibacillus campi]|uniref:LysR family transcriptional regulator n=1 Tax=Paenibacillus campi TaxID=3106031 RepID=UPI002AFF6AA4|nr:LysR family transcriptional regulator [Paenibacillus sp. SGZ-1014]